MSSFVAMRAFTGMDNIGSGAGVTVRLLAPAMASVLARAGQADALVDKAQAEFGLVLADAPKRAAAGEIQALGIGPGRWLFVGGADLFTTLKPVFAGLASLAEQGDGYAVFELSGPHARDLLAKGVALDLDHFTEADCAVTVIAHIGAILWRPAADRFVVAVFRSYAGSFWHWLSASGAEFGLVTDKPA